MKQPYVIIKDAQSLKANSVPFETLQQLRPATAVKIEKCDMPPSDWLGGAGVHAVDRGLERSLG
eukprot:c39328_g1_i1 orf=98-289(+)